METKSTEVVISTARQLIQEQKYDEALRLLNQGTPADGAIAGMTGLVYFLKQDYEQAAEFYRQASQVDPGSEEWKYMLRKSEANAFAEIHQDIPEVYHFEREKLLGEPGIPDEALPPELQYRVKRGPGWLIRTGVGHAFGAFMSAAMAGMTWSFGKLFGYRDRVWTNWYRRPMFFGVMTLAYMRERLNKYNLLSTYPAGALVGFQAAGQTPPAGAAFFRTPNGSWNNLENPMEGAAGTRFQRNVDPKSVKQALDMDPLTPNPRTISRLLLDRGDQMKEVPFLNLLAAAWIQFQNHDWISYGEPLRNDFFTIPLDEDDPARKRFWQTKMFVGKTQQDPTHGEKDVYAKTFINECTHWWDGSQLYGSDLETVQWLRSGIDGKMRLNSNDTLPRDKKGIEETGYIRNWWVGLALMHTIFIREHNAICDHLKEHNPDWDDHQLFQVARMINAALIAKIHTVEWTPAVLPNAAAEQGLNANWYGILTNLLHKGKDKKTVADINVRNPEMGGVVGNPVEKHGCPYGLTQEFVEVYRLHSLLPETIHVRSGNHEITEVPLYQARQAGSGKLTDLYGIETLIHSFATQNPGQLVLNNYPHFMRELSIPGNPVYDMGAVDLLRARERGVPRYNEFRRQLGLNPIRTFSDLNDDPEIVRKLETCYGSEPGDVEKLDLMIGTLGEAHRPTGFGFGETLFQIFLLNATRRLQADRFYTDCYDEAHYTREGLEWIDQNDFKSVLLRHYPELANTGLANIKNAFEPWDERERLDPARHPLRGFDKTLRKDPWKGDRW
ncbi:MAG TPA: peroxidase family protein [Saprospiraceae bacterium]|nr:peroxidase [Lewinellaceae bacterium]HPR00678.1 peroxidase family protein [Saprospiraceae bacterium]HRV85228.1 peroxidase family protein [Saprospiraceae bacterium]